MNWQGLVVNDHANNIAYDLRELMTPRVSYAAQDQLEYCKLRVA